MKILDIYIDPAKGYSNNASIIIVGDQPYQLSRNLIYTNNDACYWTQDPKTGVTHFLFHTSLSKCLRSADWRYQSPQSEGFGGRSFIIACNHEGRIVEVELRGPWSGGCYVANKYLPLPAMEVTYRSGQFGYIAGYLTIQKLIELCIEFQLPCEVEDTARGSRHWPELTYLNRLKAEWDQGTIDYLDEVCRAKTAKWSKYYADLSSMGNINEVAPGSSNETKDLSPLL